MTQPEWFIIILGLVGIVTLIIALYFSTRINVTVTGELKDAVQERRASDAERLSMREQMRQTAAEKDTQIMAFTSALQELREKHGTAITQLGAELVKVRIEASSARADTGQMTKLISDLTAAIATAQGHGRELEVALREARDRIALLEQDNRSKDAEIRALSHRVERAEPGETVTPIPEVSEQETKPNGTD
jgi:chromosome segregation ATPase